MFRSKRRDVVYPQSEHARVAGALALLWGNDRVPRPALPFASFVAGVALHDAGYGPIDTYSIGAMNEAERLASLRLLLEHRIGDPVADGVAKHHLRRLIRWAGCDAELGAACERRMAELAAASGFAPAAFRCADRITWLCDSVAFDLCFEEPAEGEVELCVDGAPGPVVRWTVSAEREVALEPWPLAVPSYRGYLLAYRAEGYPERLHPLPATYTVRPG